MSKPWTEVRLGDFIALQRGHDLPARVRVPGPFPVVGSGGPSGWHNEAKAQGPGVVIGRATNLGRPFWVDGPYWPLNTGLYVKDFRGNDPKFVFHLFQSLDLSGFDSGSVQPMLNRNYIAGVKLRVPCLAVQRRIAGVLGALDDLIAQEHLSAKQLDDLVHFLGMRFLANLDPGRRAPLATLASISKGYSYKSVELVPSDTLLVNLKNVGRGGEFQSRGFKPLQATPKTHQYVHNGEILVAQTDLTQDQAVVGRPIRVRRGLLTEKLVASLDLVIVRPTESTTSEYLYAVLDSAEFRAHALAHCNGTTVVHMAAAALPTFQAPIPDASALADFSDRVGTLRVAADDAVTNAERLIRVRDELLPLLLSGAVSVSEVAA
jgi:type I restriction enzyme S subunit